MKNYMGEGMYPRFGTHTLEVSLQDGEHKGTLIYEIGGNCRGMGVIDNIGDSLEGDFEPNMKNKINQKHIEIGSDGYVEYYKLFKSNPTENEDDELQIDCGDISDAIVGIKIISFERDKEE